MPEGVDVEVGVGGETDEVLDISLVKEVFISERVLEKDSVCVHLSRVKNSPSGGWGIGSL